MSTLGRIVAIVISLKNDNELFDILIHGLLGWWYVGYYIIVN